MVSGDDEGRGRKVIQLSLRFKGVLSILRVLFQSTKTESNALCHWLKNRDKARAEHIFPYIEVDIIRNFVDRLTAVVHPALYVCFRYRGIDSREPFRG
jgi:hypothetical protein